MIGAEEVVSMLGAGEDKSGELRKLRAESRFTVAHLEEVLSLPSNPDPEMWGALGRGAPTSIHEQNSIA